jgi:hypothetical protein
LFLTCPNKQKNPAFLKKHTPPPPPPPADTLLYKHDNKIY